MGLDMYLTAEKYFFKDEDIKKIEVEKIFKDINLKLTGVTFEVFYWRKANEIHKWFVDNVQEGQDDCRKYNVSLEDLEKLLSVINEILGKDSKEKVVNSLADGFDLEKAKELLPSTDGFFFGGTEYDEYYLKDLKETKEMIENVLKNREVFEDLFLQYSSSW